MSAHRMCQLGSSAQMGLVTFSECISDLPALRGPPEFAIGVIIGPETHDQMYAIVDSWGKSLEGTGRLAFFTSLDDTAHGMDPKRFPVIPCSTTERGKLGGNRRFPHLVWRLSKDLPDSVRWVIYVDSDAALNLPAVLEMLRGYDEHESVAFGQLFEHYKGTPHWGGGGGMIFSRIAIDNIVSGIERGEIRHHLVWEDNVDDNQVDSLDMWVRGGRGKGGNF